MDAVRLRLLACIGLLACLGAAHGTLTQSLYLKVPGITGPVTTPVAVAGDIEVLSTSLGFAGVDKPGLPVITADPVVFTKKVDETSPVFARALQTGKAFAGSSVVSLFDSYGGKVTLRGQIMLHNAVVKHDSIAGNVESVNLKFDAFELCVEPASATGTPKLVCSAWDFLTHTPTYPAK